MACRSSAKAAVTTADGSFRSASHSMRRSRRATSEATTWRPSCPISSTDPLM